MNPASRFLLPKLVWPVAITSAILLAVGIGGAWYVFQLQAVATDILAWNVTSIRAAEELEIGIRDIRHYLNRFALTGDLSQLDEIPRMLPNCETWLKESRRLARSSEERQSIENVERGYEQFKSEFTELQREQTDSQRRDRVQRLTTVLLQDRILKYAHDYLDFNERELAASSENSQALAERLALGLLLIGVCGAVAGLLAGYGLARSIIKSIVQISLPIHDVAGQLSEVVGPVVISDVTKLEDLDQILRTIAVRVSTVVERLRQRERESLRTEQLAALGQLAAGLAHELRNPLMSMKILVQSAQSDEPSQLDGHDLDVLGDEIGRLERLVSTFLEFARPAEPSKRRVDVADVLQQTQQLVAQQARLRRVSLHFNASPQPIYVLADAAQLRQVFLNLLLNSLDAARAEGDIWIETGLLAETDQAGTMASVIVSDNGCGLPLQLKETLFDPFVSSKSTGIGLGLTICRHIVQAHGGQISAEDRDGGGAQFRLQLPLAPPMAPAPLTAASTAAADIAASDS